MSNFKGTKGKWFIKSTSYNGSWINISSEKGIIARTFFGEQEPIVNEKEAESNAKLIACAPEMLFKHEEEIDILEKVLKQLDELEGYLTDDLKELIESKKQLIKKATE